MCEVAFGVRLTLGTSIKTAVVYVVTALVKFVCLATFLNVSENDTFDPYQEFLKAMIAQLTHRNISQNHMFQAVGLGWAFADSVLHRLVPLWVGARGLEFSWDYYIMQSLEANSNLVLSLSLAARGLGWHLPKVVTFELSTSFVIAFISWQLFAACQRPSA
uniref:BOS complex subunit TMEM147 n=1 Tax=Kalanchoe fedtschenkoi TaxID=63787 RepID=A0A7N0TPB6_KALFE